ncbi:MAG: bleomycin resistance protein [Actinomycetota bacterium]
MTDMQVEIEVGVDPNTAFTVFTEEYDQWWGNGPIDAEDTWRLVERRIEPGVGGRVIEDLGDDERVLGTITIWEPGRRLAWTAPNDVMIDVAFSALAAGTRVTVTGSVPDGAAGAAGLSMVRMAPQWFPRHVERRESGSVLPPPGPFGLLVHSATPAATGRWLASVFQLEPTADIAEAEGDPEQTWIEFRVGAAMIVLWGGSGSVGTDTPIVYVDDLDAHLTHVEAAGARVVSPITEHGFRSYTAEDCEGRQWLFMQAGPRIGR